MRRRAKRSRNYPEQAGAILFGLTMTLPALMFGGQHVPVLLLAAVLASGSALLLAGRIERTPKVLWLVLALVAYTALQLVPLPFGLVRWLSPAAAEVWSGALRPFGEPHPAWISLSMDPGATSIELLKGGIFACIVIAASGALAARGPSFIPAVLFGSSLLVALVTLAHGILGAERVYGLYLPPSGERWIRGPFVNGNNLSGFLNVGLFAGAGLWLSERERIPRWLPALGIPILGVSVVLSASRGGVAALLLGALIFVALALGLRDSRRVALLGGAALVVAAGVVSAFAVGGERVREQLSDSDFFTKTTLWRWSGRLIADYPLFGVGRGGFQTAFAPYRQASEHEWGIVFAHAENFLVDWSAEWGVPVTLAVLGVAAWIARPALSRLRRDPRALGLWVGLAVLLAQSLVDLGLEIFSISALAVVILSVVPVREGSVPRPPPWLPRIPVAVTALGALLVVVLGSDPIEVERKEYARTVAELGKGTGAGISEARAELRRAMLRHPGEAYFPLLGSFVARWEKKDPLPWLARALERAPRSGKVHMALADLLHERGALPQALMHLRFAARYDFVLRDGALIKAGKWARSSAALVAAFPERGEGGTLLRDACGYLPEPEPLACLREALRRNPNDRGARDALLKRVLDAWEAGASPCTPADASACSEEAGRLVAALGQAEDWRAANARARVLALRGDLRGAARSLIEQCPVTAEAEPCIARGLKFAEASNDLELIGQAAGRYLMLACVTPSRCADAQFRIGKMLGGRGAWRAALNHFKKGVEADPSPQRWLVLADAALQAGSSSTARLALRRAPNAGDLTPEDRRRKDELETRLNQPARLE